MTIFLKISNITLSTEKSIIYILSIICESYFTLCEAKDPSIIQEHQFPLQYIIIYKRSYILT